MPPVSKPKPKSSRSSATKTDSPVAARDELDAQAAGPGANEDALEETAKEQEAQQKAELKAGKTQAKGAVELETVAEQRTGRKDEKPLNARVDNMTRRDDSDVLEGHFCHIDYSGDGGAEAKKSVAALLGEAALQGREPGVGVADYGVYLEPAARGEDGYPVTAIVMLRDEFAANVVVPYAALKPALAGRR